ncbi:MAG: hypothetical protein QM650_01960 [Microlunatus sp.]
MNAGASEPDSSELESAAAELYAADPDDFIARRTELARAARQAGNRSLATAIGKLRKPTRSAWLVNLYARSASDELQELLELGAALRAAQEQLSAADLRRLSAQRNAVLTAASRRAVGLAEDRGYRASEAVRQEVTQTLQAALAEPGVGELVQAGTVTEAHAYGGFGVLTSPVSAAPEAGGEADRPAAPNESAAQATLAAEQAQAERARTEAEQRLQAAEAALDQAVDRADEASERATDLDGQITTVRSQLRDLEEAKAQADQQVAEAQSTVAELQAAVLEAREAYESL